MYEIYWGIAFLLLGFWLFIFRYKNPIKDDFTLTNYSSVIWGVFSVLAGISILIEAIW